MSSLRRVGFTIYRLATWKVAVFTVRRFVTRRSFSPGFAFCIALLWGPFFLIRRFTGLYSASPLRGARHSLMRRRGCVFVSDLHAAVKRLSFLGAITASPSPWSSSNAVLGDRFPFLCARLSPNVLWLVGGFVDTLTACRAPAVCARLNNVVLSHVLMCEFRQSVV